MCYSTQMRKCTLKQGVIDGSYVQWFKGFVREGLFFLQYPNLILTLQVP